MPNTEKIKQKMKDEYAKQVDQYFENYEALRNGNKLNIDEIETLIGKGIHAAKETLLTASEELMEPALEPEPVKKNFVRPVKRP